MVLHSESEQPERNRVKSGNKGTILQQSIFNSYLLSICWNTGRKNRNICSLFKQGKIVFILIYVFAIFLSSVSWYVPELSQILFE